MPDTAPTSPPDQEHPRRVATGPTTVTRELRLTISETGVMVAVTETHRPFEYTRTRARLLLLKHWRRKDVQGRAIEALQDELALVLEPLLRAEEGGEPLF